MTTFIERFMKRLPFIVFVGVMLALFILGSGPTAGQTPAATQAANLPSARPIINAEAKGSTVAGVQGSYCWPQAGTDAECDVVDEPEVTSPVSVADGDTVTFKIDPASPAPAELRAILPNNTDANGDPRQIDLLPTNGVFTVKDLAPGRHRVDIEAVYTGQSGSQPFVTYTFVLQIGTGVATAPAGTPAATESTTAPVTPEATQPVAVDASPSPAATAEVTTATPEGPIVETPTAEVSIAASTEAPTVESPTAEVALTTPTATATTPAVIETATESPTETAVATTSDAATPTQSVSVPTETPTEAATVARPTSTPQSPTIEPLPTEVFTLEPPTPTVIVEPTSVPLPTDSTVPTATPVPTTASTPGLAAIAPPMQVTVAGRTYQPIAYSACVLGLGGEQTCINRPNNAPDERISAAPGAVAQLNFQGPRPGGITVYISNADSTRILNRQTLPADNLALYALPTSSGSYILAAEYVWPGGKSTYYFRLTIGS
jgi:hypothetical protein